MRSFRPLAALLGVVALAACDENAVQDITGPIPSARIKFHNFGLNAPAVNFYDGDVKLTAIGSTTGTESTSGTAYGSVAAGAFYVGVAPGQHTFTGRIAAATDKDLVVASVPTAIEAGKAYSYFVSGVYNTTAKQVEAFVVEDPIPATVDYATAYVRFVNASANAPALTLVATPTSGTSTAPITVGGAVAYKAAGAFTALPQGPYDLGARAAGATTNAVSRTGVSFVGGRVYTITLRGDMTVTSTTATNRPFLDNTANR